MSDSSQSLRLDVDARDRLRIAGVSAVLVIVLDQATKHWVLQSIATNERLRPFGFVSLVKRFNTGGAFSVGAGNRVTAWLVTSVVIVVFVVVIRMLTRPTRGSPVAIDWKWSVALGLICGGALGNQIDRLFRSGGWNGGAVVDFIDVGSWFAVFNIADSALTVGCVSVALLSLSVPKHSSGNACKDPNMESSR